ncbi:MAG: methyltransferase domain-containing protein [Solobacterium sp.]|nr:methyltransferase domain-containing protein [Solobacterium sp.]
MTGDSLHTSENERIIRMMHEGTWEMSDPSAAYHLSDFRHALLNWYPFAQDITVLELGTGFGAMTGLLLERSEHVDTVEIDKERVQAVRERFAGNDHLCVYEADIRTFIPVKTYDCIVITDLLEEYAGDPAELIRRYTGYLKENGTLLLGFRNRNGVKYRCGALDEYVTEASDTSRLYSREDADRITQPYYAYRKYYYLMPDVRFLQGVYTDQYLPKYTMRDRIIPVDYFHSPLTMNEGDLYDELIRDHTLGEYCNYYLLECRHSTPERQVITASLSMDRGRDRAIPTILYADGTAEKKALYPEAVTVLQRSCTNLEELRKRGLLTVPQTMHDNSAVMPLIKEQQLTDCIQDLCQEGQREAILQIFTQMERNIRQSSEVTEEYDRFGSPLLVKGYIDMIPYNAFISQAGIRYYDQEFTEEKCPVGYIMFRAVFYTYIHIPELGQLIPQAEMRKYCSLGEEAWNEYMSHEMAFLDRVRSWNFTDRIRIRR